VRCWGATCCWPDLEVTFDPQQFSSDEVYLQWTLDNDEIRANNSARISEVLGLKALLTINQLMPVSITEWLGTDQWTSSHGYSEAIKLALLSEVELVLQERDRRNRDAEQKHKLEKLAAAPPAVVLPHNLGGIQSYMQ